MERLRLPIIGVPMSRLNLPREVKSTWPRKRSTQRQRASARKRKVLALSQQGLTQVEIGHRLGITQARVSQILAQGRGPTRLNRRRMLRLMPLEPYRPETG